MKMIYEHDGVSVTICFDWNNTDSINYKLFTSKKLLTMALNSVTEELHRRENHSKQNVEELIDRFLGDEKEENDGRNT